MTTAATGRWVCVVERGRGTTGLEVHPEAGRSGPAIVNSDCVTVVLDGRLTSRGALDGWLEGASTQEDDAKAILHAYRRLGDRLVPGLSGAFALVLWDAEKEIVMCVRDPIGIHPLLYTTTGGTIAVSPFVEPLLRRTQVSAGVDPVAAALTILGYPLKLEETCFSSVKRVPPGHVLEVSRQRTRLTRYWNPGEPGSENGLTAHEAAQQFDVLLRQAAARCVGEEPAAVYLSGGIDSAIVAAATALASSASGRPAPLGLSLMVDHPDLDEEPNQRAIAADLAMDLVAVSVDGAAGPGRLLRATLEVSASGSAGPAGIIQPVYDFLAREGMRRGRTTFVNGQGGDEWLMPSPGYGADRLLALDLAGVLRLWHAWRRYYLADSHAASARLLLQASGIRSLARAAVLGSARSVPCLSDLLARRVRERFPAWLAPSAALRHEIVERAVLSAIPTTSPAGLYRASRLELLDRPGRPGNSEEAFATHRRLGARIVMPLLDADVVSFLHRLPPGLLVHGGQAKALAQHVVAQQLPSFAASWSHTVRGDTYYGDLVERELPLAWRSAGGTPLLADAGVVDESSVRRAVEAGSSPGRIWTATNLEVWLRSALGLSEVDPGRP